MGLEHGAARRTARVLLDRRFLTCPRCGWVHYGMTTEEKTETERALARLIERYQLSEEEQRLYISTFRQCLRCESPADAFRVATAQDLDRATGHLVTPVFVEPEVGTQ